MYFDLKVSLGTTSSARSLGFKNATRAQVQVWRPRGRSRATAYPSVSAPRPPAGDSDPSAASRPGPEKSLGITLKAIDDMLATDLSAEEMSKGRLQRDFSGSAEVGKVLTLHT